VGKGRVFLYQGKRVGVWWTDGIVMQRCGGRVHCLSCCRVISVPQSIHVDVDSGHVWMLLCGRIGGRWQPGKIREMTIG